METNIYGADSEESTNIPISPSINPAPPTPQEDLSTAPSSGSSYEIPPLQEETSSEPYTPPVSLNSTENQTSTEDSFGMQAETEAPQAEAPIVNNLDDMVNFDTPKQETATTTFEPKKDVLNNILNTLKKRNVLLGIGAGAGLIIIIVAALLLLPILNPNKTVVISSNESPLDITIDGIESKGAQLPLRTKVKKGKHIIIAKKEGFSSVTKEIEIAGSQKEYSISFDMVTLLRAEKIIETKALFPAYNTQLSTIVYFEEAEGSYNLKEFNPANKTTYDLAEGFKNIEKVSWSPTFRQVVIRAINMPDNAETPLRYIPEYGEGTRVNWLVDLERSDLVNIKVQPLHPSIKTVSFKPEGDRIVYYFQNEDTKTIATAAPNGTGFENILSIVSLKFEPDVAWSPDGKRVAIFADKEDERIQKVESLDISTYNFESKNAYNITDDTVSLGALFSPSGDKIIYQSSNDLYVVDVEKKESDSQKEDNLNINLEIKGGIENCSWADDNNIVFFDKDTKELKRIRIDGEKETVDYKKEDIATDVNRIIYKGGSVFLFADNGVYEIKLGMGI